ncbi:MAG TPA: efflux RND transporter periplasmic adaptor subunit [Gemmatimonadaceae bacterium]|nr:efflux RND transporter periplasmic adaptor subunit [Gemmatimonadaceae bacterium]
MTMSTPDPISNSHSAGQEATSRRGLYLGAVILLLVAVVAVVALAVRRRTSADQDTSVRVHEVGRGPLVRVTTVKEAPAAEHLDLLGEADPYASVTLYAKVSGYLSSVRVDKGDHVEAGAVLATIESPETDRAYSAVKADYDNKALTASRVDKLLASKLVSPEEAGDARTQATIAHERLAGLSEEQAYEVLRAPFSGTVTARYADPGALMQNAATSQTNALPVVTVSQTNRLRVYVYLDQGDAAHVRRGTHATITLQERPDVHLAATVTRLSGVLDPKTRKMLAELDIDNRDGTIIPGSFVQVLLDLPVPARPQAPAEALIVREGKNGAAGHSSVAIVGDDNRVHFQDVTVVGNDGRTVIFGSGVIPGDRVALNLGNAVAAGTLIRPDTSSSAASSPTRTASGE